MSIIDRLPFALGRAVNTGAVTTTGTTAYDVAIGGQLFMSAWSDDRPMTRGLAPIRKEQFDNAREPGEQSLLNWWHRSQASFTGGQGILFQDPDQVSVANLNNRHQIQYGSSVGLNPWVPGKLTLLRSTSQRIADATGNNHYVVGWNDGTDRFWSAVGNVLKSDTGAATTTITWGGANTIRSLTSDGTNYFAADNVNVYKGAGNGAGAAFVTTGTTNTVVGWVKGRLMLALDNKVYECDNTPAKNIRFTHLNAGFVFTDFAEGTNAIYASGYAGNKSEIYKLVLDTTGAVPALASGGVQACQLPMGEIVLSINCYLGSFIGIGTNRGFRVGELDSNGDIQYGPLLFTTATGSAGVLDIAAYDRFFFVAMTNGIDGNGGLYRVDLGQPIYDNGVNGGIRYAYATDLQTHLTGAVTSVTNFGTSDRMVIAQVGQGAYLESATVLEPNGYFLTGKIRYSTLEPKIFKFLTVRTPSTHKGTLASSIIQPDGMQSTVYTLVENSTESITDIGLPTLATAVEWLQVRLDFTRGSVNTTGPEVNGWQLKAIPGVVRQRIFVVPLLCFDREKDNNGQWDGYEGRTLDRLEAFEQIAQRGDTVVYQDMMFQRSWTVIVDDYEFKQSAQPANNLNGYGGYLTVQMRTVADVVS